MAATRSRRPSARGYRAWPLPLAALRVAAGAGRPVTDPGLTAVLAAGLEQAAARRAAERLPASADGAVAADAAPRLILLPDVAAARARAGADAPVPVP
jgi:hypothetical protein